MTPPCGGFYCPEMVGVRGSSNPSVCLRQTPPLRGEAFTLLLVKAPLPGELDAPQAQTEGFYRPVTLHLPGYTHGVFYSPEMVGVRGSSNPSVCLRQTPPLQGGRLLLYCPSKAPLPGAAESSAACGGCSKANCLSRRHNRLFGDLIQKFALRSSLRSLPLRGKAAVAECKRLSKARSMMR